MINNKYQTLHGHTIASDGKMTHLEVLNKCEKHNVGVYAFTDHDGLPNKKTVEEIKKYSGPTDWVIGIEISSGLPKELGKKGSQHIVGLFVDPFNKALVDHCKKSQKARIERMESMVKNLRELGFDITKDDCLKASGGESVGRPHIVEAIKSKRNNLEVIAKLKDKMKKAAETNFEVKEKYEEMIEKGEEQYPYVLFLSGDAFIPQTYVDYTYRVDLDKSVELIRNAGGVALLAHWFTGKKRFTTSVIEKLFKEDRLDGAETVYGVWSKGSLSEKELISDRKILQKLINKYRKLEGGGVDCHRELDLKVLSENDWYGRLTVGMVEKIVKSRKVDVLWSSINDKE